MQPKYVRQDAELILYGITDWVESTDTGLVVLKPLRDADPTNLLSYKPVHDLDFDGAPSSSTHPLLPYPFTANELAAFFLSDVGAIVLRRFSLADWQPNERALKALRGDGNDIARGIRQALDALAWAEQVVGTFDHELQQRAQAARDQLVEADDAALEREGVLELGMSDAEHRARNERRHAAIAQQEADTLGLTERARDVHENWRRAMVMALLGPVAEPKKSVAVGLAPANEWIANAQARAREFITKQGERDLYPSQTVVAEWVAAELRKAGICGAGGKPLSGTTIKRHAMRGISSAIGRQLSTPMGRGNWGNKT